MKKLIKASIKFYQNFLSSVNFGVHTCRFHPSCSEYMLQAIDRFGVARGSFMGLFRVLRCNPFSKGGFDPVPEKK